MYNQGFNLDVQTHVKIDDGMYEDIDDPKNYINADYIKVKNFFLIFFQKQ